MSNVLSRRRLLGSMAVSALVPGCAASLSADTPGKPQSPGSSTRSAPLPPLGDATFAKRYDRLRALAREAGASIVFVTSGTTSFAYLAGGRVERSERLIALVLPVEGDPFLVAPSFEVERMHRQTR